MKKSVPILVGVIVMLMLMMGVLYVKLTSKDFLLVCLTEPTEEVARRIRLGANVNQEDERGCTPLVYALCGRNEDFWCWLSNIPEGSRPERKRASDAEVVRLLLDAGADIHQVTPDDSILAIAIQNRDLDTVKLLLDRGVNIDYQDPNGESALIIALSNSYTELAELLIDAGADVHAENHLQETALYYACLGSHFEIIDLLLGAGAATSPPPVSKMCIDLVDLSMDSNDPVRMLTMLRDAFGDGLGGAELKHLASAFQNHDHELAKILIQMGSDPSALGEHDHPLFSLMIEDEPTADLVALLIQHGADVNICEKDGETPLNMSILFKKKLCTAMLITAGADLNLDGSEPGITPLALASQVGNVELVRYLLDKGADPNVVGDDGFTPLHLALMGTPDDKPSIEVVKLLLDHGANPRIKTKAIGTPIESAEGEFLKLMESYPASHP